MHEQTRPDLYPLVREDVITNGINNLPYLSLKTLGRIRILLIEQCRPDVPLLIHCSIDILE